MSDIIIGQTLTQTVRKMAYLTMLNYELWPTSWLTFDLVSSKTNKLLVGTVPSFVKIAFEL